MRNAGQLPMRNARELDREAIARMFDWDVDEIYSSAQAFKQLYRRQPASDLTFRQYLDLLRDSGLRPSQIDQSAGGYHLARLNDAGSYTLGNCRFIPGIANQYERREGYQARPEFRELMSKMAMNRKRLECCGCGGSFTPGMFARWHGARCKNAHTQPETITA